MNEFTEGLYTPDLTPDEITTAKALALEKPSTSYIQRRMGINYNKAARLMARLEADGVVSKANAAGKRTLCDHQ